MTTQPQVTGIFHQQDGTTKQLPIDEPPFQIKMRQNLDSGFIRRLPTHNVSHRPGQDPAALEQHYDFGETDSATRAGLDYPHKTPSGPQATTSPITARAAIAPVSVCPPNAKNYFREGREKLTDCEKYAKPSPATAKLDAPKPNT